MAVIHRTTLEPTKLELLTTWLPSRPWYDGGAEGPQLARAGGFRLDDPEGEVGPVGLPLGAVVGHALDASGPGCHPGRAATRPRGW